MPCTMRLSDAARQALALKVLQRKLVARSARLAKTATGLRIEDWSPTERDGFCDACAIARLKIEGSFQVRRMIAETQGGAVSVGVPHGH